MRAIKKPEYQEKQQQHCGQFEHIERIKREGLVKKIKSRDVGSERGKSTRKNRWMNGVKGLNVRGLII